MTDFSVIIPTHNRNDFLIRAVKSALSQKTKPLEILIDNLKIKVINKRQKLSDLM